MAKLISNNYRKLNFELHKSDPHFGVSALRLASVVVGIARKAGARTVLDYGCGKGLLKKELKRKAPELRVLEYDPAIPGKRELPKQLADIVVSIDVLEHIEPDYLDGVLESIRSRAKLLVFLSIDTELAMKMLGDGRNAHLIVESQDWWETKLAGWFRKIVSHANTEGRGFTYMATPFPHQ